jgi:quinol monooxygenase YgiN
MVSDRGANPTGRWRKVFGEEDRSMRLSGFVVGTAMLAAAASSAAAAEGAVNGAFYRICYFEAATPDTGAAAGLARAFAAASRKQPGNIGFVAFEEIGRPSRLAMLEGWRDKAAAAVHDGAAVTAAFSDKIAPLLVGPLEIRSFVGFSLAPPNGPGGAQAVFVLTHVDVFPKGKDEAGALVAALAAAGRKMPGNLRFDVLQVDGHANHFTLVEAWESRRAFDASLMAAATKNFRQKLTPLEGALYDERLYRELR